MSKGFDMSYASSTRSSATSQPYNPSLASSTDSSVFNTRGGLLGSTSDPTGTCSGTSTARPLSVHRRKAWSDSPVARGKRTGSVYDTIPNLAGEKMSASASTRSSVEDPNAMSTASFLSESSISSTSTRDSVATSARGSAYVSSMPLLQQLSSADDSDYGEDMSSERASTESSDSANTTRSGSLIALNLEAKDGCSEIAI
ncbi:60S ribosomal protein L10a-1 [Phytophthora nicotianae]|uniref:60S ribosomal protein L10a-1 n=1 Tax=Phytophthora nicotianae TaxID=4792 RepID=A0A0W8DCL0_PHYNI|nr:60S ribosomal protein L10a-1 [Phytophthora nicotianae]